jgi:hypothetical protein
MSDSKSLEGEKYLIGVLSSEKYINSIVYSNRIHSLSERKEERYTYFKNLFIPVDPEFLKSACPEDIIGYDGEVMDLLPHLTVIIYFIVINIFILLDNPRSPSIKNLKISDKKSYSYFVDEEENVKDLSVTVTKLLVTAGLFNDPAKITSLIFNIVNKTVLQDVRWFIDSLYLDRYLEYRNDRKNNELYRFEKDIRYTEFKSYFDTIFPPSKTREQLEIERLSNELEVLKKIVMELA